MFLKGEKENNNNKCKTNYKYFNFFFFPSLAQQMSVKNAEGSLTQK